MIFNFSETEIDYSDDPEDESTEPWESWVPGDEKSVIGVWESAPRPASEISASPESNRTKTDKSRPRIPQSYEDITRARIREFLNDPLAYIHISDAIEERVIGQKGSGEIALAIYKWARCVSMNRPFPYGVILAAPSGCGKTETYRALRDSFSDLFPICHYDMTRLTEEGFKGDDTRQCVQELSERRTNGIGIMFLDEFDKKAIPSYSGAGTDVNAAVRSQMLTLIEGGLVPGLGIDTSNTLFIACGAFSYLRFEKAKPPLGFGGAFAEPDQYAPITRESLVKLGVGREFLGRFDTIVNYSPLSKKTVREIALVEAKKISDEYGFEIKLTDSFADKLYEKYQKSEFGCRVLHSEIEAAVRPEIRYFLNNCIEPGDAMIGLGEKTWIAYLSEVYNDPDPYEPYDWETE